MARNYKATRDRYAEKIENLEAQLTPELKETILRVCESLDFYGDWMNWQGSLPNYTEITDVDCEWLSNENMPGTWKTDQAYYKGGKRARERAKDIELIRNHFKE